MDRERIHCIILIVFLFPVDTFSIKIYQGQGSAAAGNDGGTIVPPFMSENASLVSDSSFRNGTLQLSSGGAVVLRIHDNFQDQKVHSSMVFSTEFSILSPRSNGLVFFMSSEKLSLVPLFTLEFGPGMIVTAPGFHKVIDLWSQGFQFKKGDSITIGINYHGAKRRLMIWLLNQKTGLKKILLSAKFNPWKPIQYAGFTASKKANNQTNLMINHWSSGVSTKTEIYVNKPISSFMGSSSNHQRDVIPGLIVPVLVVFSIIAAVCSFFKKRFKKKKDQSDVQNPTSSNTPRQGICSDAVSDLLSGYQKFKYADIRDAANGFHDSVLLGSGFYAKVYRGVFPSSGILLAVKRFDQNIASKQSYILEAMAIYRLRHKNILELRGWCHDSPNEPLLLYDYMPNKSLQDVLWSNLPLPWPKRYNIAVGVASALVYLHEECRPPVIHADVKEGNVMLDSDFNPKLGDFGLAISRPPYVLRRGRTPFDPPECEMHAVVTDKIDVYLYGSMVLELCSRRTEDYSEYFENLRKLKSKGRLIEAVNKKFVVENDEAQILRLLNVGLQCVEPEMEKRPSMSSVVRMLECKGGTEESGPSFSSGN